MGHTEDFVHTGDDSINRGGATDFILKLGGELFSPGDDFFAFFHIWVPSVFCLGAGFLPEGRKSDLREAVFDNFVALEKLVFFPEPELASGLLDRLADLGDLLGGKGEAVNLLPILLGVRSVGFD